MANRLYNQQISPKGYKRGGGVTGKTATTKTTTTTKSEKKPGLFKRTIGKIRKKIVPTFSEQFADAKKKGKKTFTSTRDDTKKGKLEYSTKTAAEVKAALDKVGADDSKYAVWSTDDDGIQRISESSFVIPLIKAVQELSAQVITLQNDSHSERAVNAITQEAENWTAGQMLEIILREWADDEELIDIAQTLQTRRFECGMFAEEKTEMGETYSITKNLLRV